MLGLVGIESLRETARDMHLWVQRENWKNAWARQ